VGDTSFHDAVRDALRARVAEQAIDAAEPLPDALRRTLQGSGDQAPDDDADARARRIEAALSRPRPTERNRP
jgi:hypothetical protein